MKKLFDDGKTKKCPAHAVGLFRDDKLNWQKRCYCLLTGLTCNRDNCATAKRETGRFD